MLSHPELLFPVAMFVCAHRAGVALNGTAAADAPSAVKMCSFHFRFSFRLQPQSRNVRAVRTEWRWFATLAGGCGLAPSANSHRRSLCNCHCVIFGILHFIEGGLVRDLL